VLARASDDPRVHGRTRTLSGHPGPEPAQGNRDAARGNGLTASGDQSQLTSLFSVLQPGDPGFNIVEP